MSAPAVPRVPYGFAKRIVTNMRPGETVYVRPDYIICFRQAARKAGIHVYANTIRRNGVVVCRLRRCWQNHAGPRTTGHTAKRIPVREPITGRFLTDNQRAA